MQQAPTASGIDVANWSWKVVRTFVREHFGQVLCSRSCLNYLHRLDFVLKRPKKRLLKADAAKREAFVATYVALLAEAKETGAKIFFVDEAHFRADGDLRAKWVLRGQPAVVDSTSPRLGEKTTYYSGICLETGEVEVMDVTENCTAETSATFLQQMRKNHTEPLDRHLGQRTGAPGRRHPHLSEDTRSEPASGGFALRTALTSMLTRPSGTGSATK